MMRKKRSGRKRPTTSANLQRGCASQCLIEELLPPELICHIFSLLPDEGTAALAARTCKRWFYCRPSSSHSSYSHQCQLSKTSVCANLTLLKWALQNGCPFDESLTAAAVARGNLKALQWLRQGEKEYKDHVLGMRKSATRQPDMGIGRCCDGRLPKDNGQPHTLQWLITVHMSDKPGQMVWKSNHHRLVEELSHEAAKYGQLACLKWLASAQGVRLDEKLCGVAAERGHMHVLQWLMAKGCTWDVEEVAQRAVSGGRREVLRWLREQGHPYDDDLIDNAQTNADAAQQQPGESGWSIAAHYQKYFTVLLVLLFLLWWLVPDRQ